MKQDRDYQQNVRGDTATFTRPPGYLISALTPVPAPWVLWCGTFNHHHSWTVANLARTGNFIIILKIAAQMVQQHYLLSTQHFPWFGTTSCFFSPQSHMRYGAILGRYP